MLVTDSARQIKSLLARAGRGAARMLFPPVCGGCRNIVSEPGALCPICWPQLRFLEQPWCDVLGTPMSFEMGANLVSADAIANPPPFDKARSAAAYDGIARRMVQNLKYRDRTDLAPWMARWMMRAGVSLIKDADVVVPVPLHRRRFLLRRFNQSAELARAIARLSEIEYAPEALIRIRSTRKQVGLAAREREYNVRGAFRVPDEAEIKIRGRNVLIIDDVYTTGATVYSASRALKKAKPSGISVLTFARVVTDV